VIRLAAVTAYTAATFGVLLVLVAVLFGAFMRKPHPWGELTYCSHEIILGVPQSGKTTEAKRRVASARRVVFFSPTRDYDELGEIVTPEDLEDDPELLDGTFLRLVVRPHRADLADGFARTLDVLCAELPRRGGAILVADECSLYRGGAEKALCALHTSAHHDGVASILVSQRATGIPPTCHATATRVVSLLQKRAEDLDELERQYGDDVPDIRERVARWLPGDPPVVWELPTLHHRRNAS
jgi:hypothetical protein